MVAFVIEDNMHAELCGEFSTYESAFEQLEERAKIAWDKEPNKCPCQSWKSCKRQYEIIEFNKDKTPWEVVNITLLLEISSKGIVWYK